MKIMDRQTHIRRINGTEWPVVTQVHRDGPRKWRVVTDLCNGIPESSKVYPTRRAALIAAGAPEPERGFVEVRTAPVASLDRPGAWQTSHKGRSVAWALAQASRSAVEGSVAVQVYATRSAIIAAMEANPRLRVAPSMTDEGREAWTVEDHKGRAWIVERL